MQPGLIEVMKNILDVEALAPSDNMKTIKSWDSLRHLNLIMALEEHFGVTFEPEEIPELTSVEKLSQAIGRRSAA